MIVSELENMTVVIVPVFGNRNLFKRCINSIISQTVSDLRILVIDNGASSANQSLRSYIKSLNDARILYQANPSNIGSQPNFAQALFYARFCKRFMIIPSDVALNANALFLMTSKLEKSGASICYGRTLLIELSSPVTQLGEPRLLQWPHNKEHVFDSTDLIRTFFLDHNIDSEWTHFTFIGALIDGSLIRAIPSHMQPYYDHGLEIYISLLFLIFCPLVHIIDNPTLIHYLGARRHGTAIRLKDGYTRYEPLVSQSRFIHEYECLLVRRGINVRALRSYMIKKCLHSLIHHRLIKSRYIASVTFLIASHIVRLLIELPYLLMLASENCLAQQRAYTLRKFSLRRF